MGDVYDLNGVTAVKVSRRFRPKMLVYIMR